MSATYPALPCQKSFIEAITGREAPSSMMAEVQARFQFWSHPSSPPGSVLPWPALLPFGPWPSWVRGPSFLLPLPGPSNPFSSCGRQGQGGEVVWTEEGGGILVWVTISSVSPLTWDSIKSRRPCLVLHWIPMVSRVEGSSWEWLACAGRRCPKSQVGTSGDKGWLKTSKSSFE